MLFLLFYSDSNQYTDIIVINNIDMKVIVITLTQTVKATYCRNSVKLDKN